jgi:hypothetical protein
MSRDVYYESLKALAREKRAHYGVDTAVFGFREVRIIYKEEFYSHRLLAALL